MKIIIDTGNRIIPAMLTDSQLKQLVSDVLFGGALNNRYTVTARVAAKHLSESEIAITRVNGERRDGA